MGAKEKNTSFSDLALALANDYESIYVVDSKDDSYVEYYSEGDELQVKRTGTDFYEEVKIECRQYVWPEDQERFLETFKKERVETALESGESFGLNYRLNDENNPQYYFLKTIRKKGEDIIIGVQNIDKQVRRELKDQERVIIYSEIAGSLASMFEVIYHVDINTGHYTEYYSSSAFAELGIESGGDDDFFNRVKTDIRKYIYEEDREMLVNELSRDNLLSHLQVDEMYSVVYRQNYDDTVQYMNLIAFRQQSNDDHLVIGIRNIDEQKRQEDEVEIYDKIAGSLASRYEVIYYVDLDTDSYVQYSASEQYAKLGTTKKGGNFFEDAVPDIKRYIHKDDQRKVLRVMDKENLLSILDKEGSMTMNYRQFLDGKSIYVSLLVVRPKNDEKHLLMGVTNIDAQVRRERAIKSESQSFDEIATALAHRYEVIYQVNTKTNEYLEFSSSKKYARLEVGIKGSDFFADTQENMKKDIFPEDYPMMAHAMQKDYMLKILEQTGKFVLNYRLIIDGRPQFVTLFAVKSREESDFVIVAVSNIDESRRMEIDLETALGNAMDMANRDPLTGLYNKRYYAQQEIKADRDIDDQIGLSFAILVCDINDLKKINDEQGHKIGDEYIQDAAKILSEVYKTSTLYRIGGDEFAVVLKGDDYKHRDELISKLLEKLKESRDKGRVTFAFGMSEYKPTLDNRVQDVFDRADRYMFANKRYYVKKERNEEISPIEKAKLEHDMRFHDLFEQLISCMTDVDNLDRELIMKLLDQFGDYFRVSKGVAKLYKSPHDELVGNSETLVCHDTGIEGEEIMSLRIVTKIMSIAVITIYMSPNERPLGEEERRRLELVVRTTLTYLSRNRIRDIAERMAFYDDDGFRNLRSFYRYIMENRKSIGGKSALMYNIRHFSFINSEISDRAGNLITKQYYENLESMIGDGGTVARLGGGNFVAICDNSQLGNVLAYLNETTIVYDNMEAKSVIITSDVGVFRIPNNYVIQHPGNIMEKIVTPFRAAQNGGKDNIVFYSGNLVEDRNNVMKVQHLFPDALRDEEFKVYYQPKVDIRTGEIIGAEALCRWFHRGKMISPGEFIPMLEETSEICKLDFYMLDHVCRDIRGWLDMGKKVVRISVNLSRKHMINSNLLENILKIIDRHNVPHSCIEIELTETTTDVGFSDLKRVVSGLQSVGIFTSVDDFGMGYSSLNLIRELPWNVIKVDRSFLPENLESKDEVSRIMFKHVIAMVNEMNVECIVEGVETEEQLGVLMKNNCNYAQGFFFDKPLPKEEFEEKMTRGYYDVSEEESAK